MRELFSIIFGFAFIIPSPNSHLHAAGSPIHALELQEASEIFKPVHQKRNLVESLVIIDQMISAVESDQDLPQSTLEAFESFIQDLPASMQSNIDMHFLELDDTNSINPIQSFFKTLRNAKTAITTVLSPLLVE